MDAANNVACSVVNSNRNHAGSDFFEEWVLVVLRVGDKASPPVRHFGLGFDVSPEKIFEQLLDGLCWLAVERPFILLMLVAEASERNLARG
jgi:hypothetical protein